MSQRPLPSGLWQHAQWGWVKTRWNNASLVYSRKLSLSTVATGGSKQAEGWIVFWSIGLGHTVTASQIHLYIPAGLPVQGFAEDVWKLSHLQSHTHTHTGWLGELIKPGTQTVLATRLTQVHALDARVIKASYVSPIFYVCAVKSALWSEDDYHHICVMSVWVCRCRACRDPECEKFRNVRYSPILSKASLSSSSLSREICTKRCAIVASVQCIWKRQRHTHGCTHTYGIITSANVCKRNKQCKKLLKKRRKMLV